jgi:hypothetical protein
MGLDMYLEKKNYVKNWDYMSPEELHKITVKKGGKIRKDIKPKRISHIVEEVGYWRKFNALHDWFVRTCQDGVDDCKEYYVDPTVLKQLLDILKKIKANKKLAPELLPTAQGFFFGGTDYDEYYFDQVKETISLLEKLLKENPNGEFYYTSSW